MYYGFLGEHHSSVREEHAIKDYGEIERNREDEEEHEQEKRQRRGLWVAAMPAQNTAAADVVSARLAAAKE